MAPLSMQGAVAYTRAKHSTAVTLGDDWVHDRIHEDGTCQLNRSCKRGQACVMMMLSLTRRRTAAKETRWRERTSHSRSRTWSRWCTAASRSRRSCTRPPPCACCTARSPPPPCPSAAGSDTAREARHGRSAELQRHQTEKDIVFLRLYNSVLDPASTLCLSTRQLRAVLLQNMVL